MADMRWVVDGDHYNIVLNGQLQQDPYPFKLDPSRRRIDVNHHETPKGTYGGKATGIYRVSENSLTVCYDLTGREYPRSFDAGPGSPASAVSVPKGAALRTRISVVRIDTIEDRLDHFVR